MGLMGLLTDHKSDLGGAHESHLSYKSHPSPGRARLQVTGAGTLPIGPLLKLKPAIPFPEPDSREQQDLVSLDIFGIERKQRLHLLSLDDTAQLR